MSMHSRNTGALGRFWSSCIGWLQGDVRNRFRLVGATEETETPRFFVLSGLSVSVLAFALFVALRALAARPVGIVWPQTVSWVGERGGTVVVSLGPLFAVLGVVVLLSVVVLFACVTAWHASWTDADDNDDGTK